MPEKTVNYSALVKMAFCQAYPNFAPIDGPIILSIHAFFLAPQYLLKKYPEQIRLELVRDMNKPDMSNIFKVVEDALKGVYYCDDSRISDYDNATKRYSLRPRLEVWASPADLIESF
jgi:Holliday junction resolvase RusA-like endonuclease